MTHNRVPIALLAAMRAAMLVCMPMEAVAQEVADPLRVRVYSSATTPRITIGDFAGRTGDAVYVRVDARDSALVIPAGSIVYVDTRTRVRRHTGSGALTGAGVGAAAGLFIGLASFAAEPSDFNPAPAFALLGAAVGAFVGMVVGHGRTSLDWENARVEDLPLTPTMHPPSP